jgi:hypothetical protein
MAPIAMQWLRVLVDGGAQSRLVSNFRRTRLDALAPSVSRVPSNYGLKASCEAAISVPRRNLQLFFEAKE